MAWDVKVMKVIHKSSWFRNHLMVATFLATKLQSSRVQKSVRWPTCAVELSKNDIKAKTPLCKGKCHNYFHVISVLINVYIRTSTTSTINLHHIKVNWLHCSFGDLLFKLHNLTSWNELSLNIKTIFFSWIYILCLLPFIFA